MVHETLETSPSTEMEKAAQSVLTYQPATILASVQGVKVIAL